MPSAASRARLQRVGLDEPKYSVRDNCERIKDEWNALERKWQGLRNEADRLHMERSQYEAHFLQVSIVVVNVRHVCRAPCWHC